MSDYCVVCGYVHPTQTCIATQRGEILRLEAALAAEKEAHGQTFEALVNWQNMAYVLADALEAVDPSCKALEAYGALMSEFRTAAKPEEAK